jgi:hypothetical protein
LGLACFNTAQIAAIEVASRLGKVAQGKVAQVKVLQVKVLDAEVVLVLQLMRARQRWTRSDAPHVHTPTPRAGGSRAKGRSHSAEGCTDFQSQGASRRDARAYRMRDCAPAQRILEAARDR